MSNRYSMYSGQFIHGGGTLTLNQLRSQSLRRNGVFNSIRPGGAVDNAAHILSTANPSSGFATRDLATALGTISLTAGLYCSGGAVLSWQKRLEGGAFASGSNHVLQTISRGFLNPIQIEVDAESQLGAEMTLELTAMSTDGSNPVATAASSALSATAPAFNSVYYMGGVWLGAAQVTSLVRARIVPGITYSARRADGGVFTRSGCSSIVARDPAILLDFLDVGMIDTVLGTFFAGALGSTLAVYLQKGSVANDGRVSAASGSHIKISAASGTWGPDEVAVSQGEEDGIVTVAVMPSAALALSTVSTIP